jgi:hypothetical protein
MKIKNTERNFVINLEYDELYELARIRDRVVIKDNVAIIVDNSEQNILLFLLHMILLEGSMDKIFDSDRDEKQSTGLQRIRDIIDGSDTICDRDNPHLLDKKGIK